MSIGYTTSKATVDNTMGGHVVALNNALRAISSFKLNQLDNSAVLNDTVLGVLGYSGGEITTIRAAYTDLDKLNQISRAGAVQAATNNFWFNAQLLGGIQLL
jgi:hypothetical protein